MAEVAVAYVTILPSFRGMRGNLERGLRPHVTGAGVTSGGLFGRSFGRAASTALTSNTTGIRSALRSFSTDSVSSFTTITAAASTLIGVLGGIGIRTAASLQSAQIGFETLLGSAKRASAFLTDIRNFAVRTPFEVGALIANSRALLGVGVSAKGIIPTLKSLGNVTAAFGLNQEQFNGILRAFTQIASKGKVQAEELLQMSENGLPAMQLFAKGLGLSVNGLLALTKTGELTAQKALPALLKQLNKDYGGSMAKQFDTLTGVYNNFKEATKLALSDGVQPLVPILQSALPAATAKTKGAIDAASQSLGQFINGLRGKQGLDVTLFERIGVGVSTAFSRVRDAFAGIKTIVDANRGTLAEIGSVITTRVLPALGLIADALGQGAKVALATFFDVLGTVGVPTVRALARGIERLAPALRSTVDFITANKDFIAPFAASVAAYLVTVKAIKTATKAWAFWQGAVNALMLTNPYIAAFAAVLALTAGMIYLNETTGAAHDAFISVGRVATAAFVAAGRALTFIIKKSIERIRDLLRVLEAISNPLGKLTGFKSPFGKAADQLDDAAKATKTWTNWLKQLPSRIDIPVNLNVKVNAAGLTPLTGPAVPNGSALTNAITRASLPSDDAIAKRLRDQARARSKARIDDTKKPGGGFDMDSLLAQLGLPDSTTATNDAAKAAKARIDKVAEAAKQALKDARQALRDLSRDIAAGIKSFADPTGITSATGAAATPNSVARFLTKQLATIKRFQANLKALSKRGISNVLLRQIAEAGPDQGGKVAEALVRSDDGQFAAISKTAAAINRRANASGAFVAGQILGPSVAEARTNVESLVVNVNNPKAERASTTAPKAVRRALLAAG